MKPTSLSKTKPELTAFLAQKVMERGEATGKQVIVAWASECKATNKDHLQRDHEEAATKIILYVLDATADTATELSIYSSGTDVRRYLEMCPNTSDWISNNLPNNQVDSQDSCNTSIACLDMG